MPALRARVLHQNILLLSYIGETHLKMTTRARAFYLLKNRRNPILSDFLNPILSDFLKSDPQLYSRLWNIVIKGYRCLCPL